jgi:MoxR-like ATPase
MKVIVPYPGLDEEKEMVRRILDGTSGAVLQVGSVGTVLAPGEFAALRDRASLLRVESTILDYAVRLCAATRSHSGIQAGAGPRGSLALVRCARAKALLEGRDFVIPDDISALAVPVLAHRITLSAESELEGMGERRIIEDILSRIPAPRGDFGPEDL